MSDFQEGNQMTNDGAGNTNDHTSLSLLELAKQENQAAWTRMYRLYAPLVRHWCRFELDTEAQDVEALVQEIFLAVFRGLPNYRRDRPGDTFRGWLRVIARNKVRDYFRRQEARQRGTGGSTHAQELQAVPAPGAPDPDQEAYETRLLVKEVLRLVRASFSDRDWEIFQRTAIREEDIHDVADDLGISPNVCYLARHRIRERFKLEFQHLEQEGWTL